MRVENKDIIITDPCYIIPDDKDSDWDKCDYGEYMDELGFTNYETSNTEDGDWSCGTFTRSEKTLGAFCADAGMVGVFELDEVLKYNPNFDYHINKPWTTTWIKNYTGEIHITYEDDDCGYSYVTVIGKGSIDFYTKPI